MDFHHIIRAGRVVAFAFGGERNRVNQGNWRAIGEPKASLRFAQYRHRISYFVHA